MLTIGSERPLFDIPPGMAYFNTAANSPLLNASRARFEQLQAWSITGIAQSLGEINGRIQARLEALGFELSPPEQRCPHMFGARPPAHFPADLVGSLRAQNVFVSQRGSSVRFAPHLHVTEADIEQLFEALTQAAGR